MMEDDEIETLDEEFLEESPVSTPNSAPTHKQWTHWETLRLFTAYKQCLSKKPKHLTKRQFFEDIANNLEKDNMLFTGYQVENKFRGLLRTHRLNKQKGNYFSNMNELALLDPSMTAEHYFKPTSEVVEQPREEEAGGENEGVGKKDKVKSAKKSKNSTKKVWSIQEVYQLVDEYEILLPEKKNFASNKQWFDVIASNLRDNGVMCNATNCEFKWSNLLKSYKQKGTSGPRSDLYKKIERIRVSLGLQTYGSEDENTVNSEEEEDHFLNNDTSIFVKTEPTHDEEVVEEIVVQNLPIFGTSNQTSPQTFEEKILNYLQQKEIEKNRRHEETMEIRKKKLLLLEKYCSSQH